MRRTAVITSLAALLALTATDATLARAEDPPLSKKVRTIEEATLELEALRKKIRVPITDSVPPPPAKDNTKDVGGFVKFEWSDYIGASAIDVRLTTSKQGPGAGLLSLLQVDSGKVRITLRPYMPNAVDEVITDLQHPLQVSLDHQRAGADAATWMAQLSACPTLLVTPPHISDAYRYRTPTWSVQVWLAPKEFQAYREKIRNRAPGAWVSLPRLELSDALQLSCGSFTIF